MEAGKYTYQVKGLSIVPINWDTLRPRKLKMEAWSNETTTKRRKIKSRKKDNKIGRWSSELLFHVSAPSDITIRNLKLKMEA